MAHVGAARDSLYAEAFRWLRKAIKKRRKYHHIFRGEIRRDNNGALVAQGLHHRYLGHDMPDRRIGQVVDEGIYGTYTAPVWMKGPTGQWVRKVGVTGFFPDNWHPKQVVAAIDHAFARSSHVPGTNGRRWRGVYEGLTIQGSYHRNGAWSSGWPVVRW